MTPLDTTPHTTDFLPTEFTLKWQIGYSGGIPDLLPMNRSPGKHLSTAVRARAVERHDFPLGDPSDFEKPAVMNRMALGNALEWAIINMCVQAHPQRFIPGIEIATDLNGDPVFGTNDMLDTTHEVLDEIKLTWANAKQDIYHKKSIKYTEQGAGYLHQLGWNKLRIWVCHLNGFYVFNKFLRRKATWEQVLEDGPLLRIYTKLYTDRELIDNWNRLMKYL